MAAKVKKKPIAVVPAPPDTFSDNIRLSRLGRSVVGNYARNNSSDFGERYKNAVAAFRRETSVILDFGGPLDSLLGTLRYESVKMYIIKVLLFVGTPPTGNGLAVLARLIEVLTIHPEIPLEEVISDFAKTHAATVDSVTHIIEKYFNIYDNYFFNRVVALTKSHPMTAKDVLCDLSVYIRLKFINATEQ